MRGWIRDALAIIAAMSCLGGCRDIASYAPAPDSRVAPRDSHVAFRDLGAVDGNGDGPGDGGRSPADDGLPRDGSPHPTDGLPDRGDGTSDAPVPPDGPPPADSRPPDTGPPPDQGIPGAWYQVDRKDCPTYCQGIGKTNVPSFEGTRCASGEVRPKSAILSGIQFIHGCWGGCTPLFGLQGGASFGVLFCYVPGQTKDADKTDRTVACYCN